MRTVLQYFKDAGKRLMRAGSFRFRAGRLFVLVLGSTSMNVQIHQQPDISDELWEQLAPLFPPAQGRSGRPVGDSRVFLNGVLWVVRTGSPWRRLPKRYGNWNSVYVRFRRLCKSGFWEKLCAEADKCPALAGFVLDARQIRDHQEDMGASGVMDA